MGFFFWVFAGETCYCGSAFNGSRIDKNQREENMTIIKTLGLIGGGQMGEALIRGVLAAGLVEKTEIMCAEPDDARREYLKTEYGIATTVEASALAGSCEIILLAVKPQVMPMVLALYKPFITRRHLVISIAAGVSLEALGRGLCDGAKIVRVMPNTPALVLEGASALSGNQHVAREDMNKAVKLFSVVGSCVELPESMLDAVTGLSGSGPGYVFTFIEALIDGGVLAGLPRPVAEKLVLQTVYGSVKLAMETGEHPAVLKGKVTSPGGTTIAGLHVLEESGFRGAVMSAVDAATNRSKELGS